MDLEGRVGGGGRVQNVRRRGGGGGGRGEDFAVQCGATALDFGCVLGVQNRKRVVNLETTAQTLRQPLAHLRLLLFASDFREKNV